MKLPTLVALLLAGAVAGPAVPAPARPQSKPAPANAPAAAPPAAAPSEVTGTVVDTMDSGGYTYLKLKTASGEVWAAVNKADVKKGSTATVANAMLMENFESKTLNRKFDKIYFGSLASGAGAGSPASAGGALPPGHPAVGSSDAGAAVAAQHAAAAQGPADAGPPIKVSKASGANGRTVAEIYAQKAALKDKTVVLHGKVVKFLPEIMGKNWIHVRDGSGSAADKNDDMTVTTKDTVAVGDVVTVTGTVRLDRNFGAGYAYPVMIEDAKVTK
jgi:hypothetical protein